jgi:signal transduction histidine kinase
VSDARSNDNRSLRQSSVLGIALVFGTALLWLVVAALQIASALKLRAATEIRLGKEMANGVFYRHLILHGIPTLLLGCCVAAFIFLTYRVQKLAKAQMELLASVSHELRTPLSAIFSAGENIRDGYVHGHKDLKFYGTILTSQARRLMDLLDRILLFASTRAGTKEYFIARLAVPDILAAVRKNIKEQLAEERYTLEEHIDSDLPEVFGDLSGVSVCLQNLIENAVKYGGADHWSGLSVTRQHTKDHGLEIQFRVQDHGRGISASDLPRIFEPFYRAPDVVAAQIHGTGLGLALSKRIAESLGGRISVISEPGLGSTFTLHLRAAPARQFVDHPISASAGQ